MKQDNGRRHLNSGMLSLEIPFKMGLDRRRLKLVFFIRRLEAGAINLFEIALVMFMCFSGIVLWARRARFAHSYSKAVSPHCQRSLGFGG